MSSVAPAEKGHLGHNQFPLRFFVAATLISLLAAVAGGGLSAILQGRLNDLAAKQFQLTEYSSQVMLFDEALTMSARMAAATGDPAYVQRYHKFDAYLSALLIRTESLLSQPELLPFVQQTNEANRKLVDIERSALALSAEGRLPEASALLGTDEYAHWKGVYADGVEKAVAQQREAIEGAHRQLQLATYGLMASIGVIILVLLLTWYFALRAGLRWSDERLRSEAALSKARDELEVRVRERTAELQTVGQAQHENAEALQEAQRVAHVGSWAWLPDADTTEWSDEAYQIFGRDPAQPAPSLREHADFMAPESYARLKAAVEASRDTGAPYELDLEFVRPDGTEAWVSARGEAQRGADGHTTRLRGTVHDITERKHAEEKAQEGEATFRSLVENGIAGITIAAQDGKIEYINPRFANMLGFAVATDLIGHSILEFVSDADKPTFGDALNALVCERVRSMEVAISILPKHGGTLSVLMQSSLTIFKGRRTIIAVALDITERKESEEKITKLNEQLAATVSALGRHAEAMTSIGKLSDILQSCHSAAEAYPIIAMTAGNLFRELNGALSIVATGTHELETVVQWGSDQMMRSSFYLDDCWALRTGQTYEINGPGSGAPCRHFMSAPPGSYVCLPLTVHGETSGLLHVNVTAAAVIDAESNRLMLAFGDVVKLSLANLRLRETLSEQAVRDPLTALFNRRYLTETLPREIRRAQRDEVPLTVAILDIDLFKGFNDSYGHDAGDAVLRELGAVLITALRAGDIACRYGGEEFLLVIPECTMDDARTRLEQIRADIKARKIVFRNQALPGVTVSVGLAAIGGELTSGDLLITAADTALYAAKRNGRDRIETFSAELSQAAPSIAA